jgi:hypothetical protein
MMRRFLPIPEGRGTRAANSGGIFWYFLVLYHRSGSKRGTVWSDSDDQTIGQEMTMSEDYLELKLSRKAFGWILAGVILLVLTGLGALGRFHTPDPARVIWWTDWTEWKVERRYRKVLAQMQKDLAELADVLQGRPDPVKAELAATRMEQRYVSGLGLLEGQREVALTAAQVVRDWAAGYEKYDAAVEAVNEAIEIMQASEYHIGGNDGRKSVQEKANDGDSTGNEISTNASADEDWWTDGD